MGFGAGLSGTGPDIWQEIVLESYWPKNYWYDIIRFSMFIDKIWYDQPMNLRNLYTKKNIPNLKMNMFITIKYWLSWQVFIVPLSLRIWVVENHHPSDAKWRTFNNFQLPSCGPSLIRICLSAANFEGCTSILAYFVVPKAAKLTFFATSSSSWLTCCLRACLSMEPQGLKSHGNWSFPEHGKDRRKHGNTWAKYI